MESLGKAIIGGVIAVGAITFAVNNTGGMGSPAIPYSHMTSPGSVSGGDILPSQTNSGQDGDILPSVDPRCANGNFRGGQGMDPQTLSDMQKMIQDACSRWQAQMDQHDRNGNTGPVPTIEIKPPDNSLEGS